MKPLFAGPLLAPEEAGAPEPCPPLLLREGAGELSLKFVTSISFSSSAMSAKSPVVMPFSSMACVISTSFESKIVEGRRNGHDMTRTKKRDRVRRRKYRNTESNRAISQRNLGPVRLDRHHRSSGHQEPKELTVGANPHTKTPEGMRWHTNLVNLVLLEVIEPIHWCEASHFCIISLYSTQNSAPSTRCPQRKREKPAKRSQARPITQMIGN